MHGEVMVPDLLATARALRIPSDKLGLCTDWDAAFKRPLEEAQAFLTEEHVLRASSQVGLSPEMARELCAFAVKVSADPQLLAYFWYCRDRVLHDTSLVKSWEEPWPPLDSLLGAEAGQLNVLVMLAAVPEMLQIYRDLGIPDDVRLETVSDLKLWMETDVYFLQQKRWGITPWIARWLCKHWQARILRFGRLQFVRDSFGLPLRAFRRRADGELMVLAEGGQHYDAKGGAWDACCGTAEGVWTSVWQEAPGWVEGNPISGEGRADAQPRRLQLADWEQILAKGDDVLGVSIPVGGPLTHEACGEAFRRAIEGYERYLPGFKYRALWIKSWLLDPRFDGMLPEDANIVRLQRELFLYPGVQGDNAQIYDRVFGWGVKSLEQAPRKSSLQRAVAAYLENGGHFHGGYGFMLKEDFHWGGQVYRARAREKG